MNENAIAVAPQQAPTLALSDVLQQVQLIQSVLEKVMLPGQHYGVIPGTEPKDGEKPKQVLLKPGAEKLCMVFRLAPTFNVRTTTMPGNHREERVTCTLTHIPSGSVFAQADGSCSTMEVKYRYRNGKPKCPTCGVDAIFRSKKEAEWFCWSKKGGCGETFELQDKRITSQSIGLTENKDIADTWNTVMKMACKRALVAATLIATACSDMFVTEVEAPESEDDDEEPKEKPKASAKKGDKPKEESPPKMTTKQELLRDCVQMATALHEAGIGKDDQVTLMVEVGVTPPAKWSDLSEADLAKVKTAFGEQLKMGKETKA